MPRTDKILRLKESLILNSVIEHNLISTEQQDVRGCFPIV